MMHTNLQTGFNRDRHLVESLRSAGAVLERERGFKLPEISTADVITRAAHAHYVHLHL